MIKEVIVTSFFYGGVMSFKKKLRKNKFIYQLAVYKHQLNRKRLWIKQRKNYAVNKKLHSDHRLPQVIYSHKTVILRKLGNVDMSLQHNKATNLKLALHHVNGVIIEPNEIFSFWYLVGKCTHKKGYKEGLTINNGMPSKGIGGGMCQFTNLIHWLVLHSPLEIIEHHHHNGFDLFPDYGRQVPFGTGTSIMYNYLDYQFKNTTNQCFQLWFEMDEMYLKGELRSELPISNVYHIKEEKAHFKKVGDSYYRYNEIYRQTVDPITGITLSYQKMLSSEAKVMYDESFIPKEQIMT